MIKGDSVEYTKLAEWIKTLPVYTEAPEQILTCEIGIREGLGSKIIMDEVIGRCGSIVPYKHIGIDPYGNLPINTTMIHQEKKSTTTRMI